MTFLLHGYNLMFKKYHQYATRNSNADNDKEYPLFEHIGFVLFSLSMIALCIFLMVKALTTLTVDVPERFKELNPHFYDSKNDAS